MVGLLIGICILVILINITVIILLFKFKKAESQMMEEDNIAIHQSMEDFVNQIEKENDELYQKLIAYIKDKEAALDERIRVLENGHQKNLPVTSVTADEPLSIQTEVEHKVRTNQNHNDDQHGYENISKLYKQGFSAKQIAKVLQIDRGEVELIINMFKQQNQSK